jgi:hypothetical protein
VTEADAADWLRWGRSSVHHAVERLRSADPDLRRELALAAVELDRELLRQPGGASAGSGADLEFSGGEYGIPAS